LSSLASRSGHPSSIARLEPVPLGRFGKRSDLDGVLLLLVSDAGRFMTGTTVVVDGGQSVVLRG